MGIVNRRNAVLGWSVWQIGTRMMKRKAKSAASVEGGKRKKSVVALSVAGLVGALAFWRKTRDSGED